MKSSRALGRAVAAVAAFAVTLGAASLAPGQAPGQNAVPLERVLPEAVSPADDATAAAASGTSEFTVLLDGGAAREAVVAAIEAAGGRVVGENTAVGALVVNAPADGFVERVAAADGVYGATRTHVVGGTRQAMGARTGTQAAGIDIPHRGTVADQPAPGPAGLDPLDTKLWGLAMIKADVVRERQAGDRRVQVGVIDTGIDASNPDIAPNFDAALSRNFVTDIPVDPTGAELDGPCEFDGCVDPVGHDDAGHGTHVAGTIAAAANGFGLSGVAPNVTLVSIRAGQDAGLFFLQPVVDALTYGADSGLDVINMSFYVDPWLYNCTDNPADSPEARIEQRTTIEAMSRALEYAHGKGVTLVGSLGNENEDLGRPQADHSSPNYPPAAQHSRPIDNLTCFDLPVEGPHVIGVSAMGPTGERAGYSNYGTEQVSLAAPGGWLGTGGMEDLILSTYPKHVLQENGNVDGRGEVTPQGAAQGVQRACGETGCGYYAYLQGTSMAAPHVTGVAALVVSQHGDIDPQHPANLTMPPAAVEDALVTSAMEHVCPVADQAMAPCEGTPSFNGHYGHGIVDAAGAVDHVGTP